MRVMKCENCRFLVEISNENGYESYCPLFGEDTPDPFYSEDECNIKKSRSVEIR